MHSDPSGHSLICIFVCMAIGAAIGFSATAYVDYKDDGEVFNGSVGVVDYVANTLVGAAVGAAAGYAAPGIASSIASSGAAAGATLAGGEAVAVAVTGEQVAGAAAAAGIIVNSFANPSGKEMASDKPGWVNREMVDPNKSAQQNAFDILNNKYGKGNWKKGPTTEYNKIVKWITRKLFRGR